MIHIKCVRKTETMKTSLLLLTALSVALLLHASRHTHASDLSQLLDKEIRDLKDEIEKRGKKRKPCGFTWFCRRRRSRRSHGKRVSEINISVPYNTDTLLNARIERIFGRGGSKYRDLSWVSRSIICQNRRLRQIIDVRASIETPTNMNFAKIEFNNCFIIGSKNVFFAF